MGRASTTAISFPVKRQSLDHASGEVRSHSDFCPVDTRFPRLLLLLGQMEKSLCGLQTVPESELTEIIYGAIRSCGFVDPLEAEYAIAVLLETLESHRPLPDRPP